jgi:YVTN family beta-propeller protein
MYSDSVAVLNLTTSSVSGYINLRRHSESIVITGNKAFISDWIGGTEVMVVNTVTDKVTDSIKVGMEPESMVIDKNNTLWVLCNGGWMRSYFAELIGINTSTNTIDKKFTFPSKQDSPSCIQINGSGETLYYLESGSGVRQMNITSPALPSSAFIAETGHYFYKFGVNPVNGDILITDAIDYQQKGLVLHYKKDGTLGSTLTADIIPGLMCFKLNDNFKAK